MSPGAGFSAQSDTWQLGGCMLSRVQAPAIRVDHTTAHLRRNHLHHWVVTLGKRATSLISSDDATLSVPPGIPFVLSLADAFTSERAEDQRLQLYLSREQFAYLAPALDRSRFLALDTPLGSVLADYLVLLERILPEVAPDDLPRLNDAVGAVVAACLAPDPDRVRAAEPQIDLARRDRVAQIVRKNLRSPALSPRLLCRSLRISRSKLYRLMDAEGGVAHYIQRQRLLEAYALLSDPSVNEAVTDIAENLRFADTSGFSRAFRREFGATPSEVRASARPAPGPDTDPVHSNSAASRLRSLLCTV